MKCEKCNGSGKIFIKPTSEMKERLKQEIEYTVSNARERAILLKTLDGVRGKCPVCKGTGVKP